MNLNLLPPPQSDDNELAVQARTDRAAFGVLFDRTLPKIYGYLYRRVGHREIAEDLASRTFEKALANIHRFSPERGTWNSWIYRIATNVLFDHFRAGNREVPMPEEEWNEPSVPETASKTTERGIDRKMLLAAMAKLPERYRSALALRFFEEKTTEEMAAILKVSRGTLAVLIHRSLRALEKIVKETPLAQ